MPLLLIRPQEAWSQRNLQLRRFSIERLHQTFRASSSWKPCHSLVGFFCQPLVSCLPLCQQLRFHCMNLLLDSFHCREQAIELRLCHQRIGSCSILIFRHAASPRRWSEMKESQVTLNRGSQYSCRENNSITYLSALITPACMPPLPSMNPHATIVQQYCIFIFTFMQWCMQQCQQ